MTLGPVHFVAIGLQNDRLKGEVAKQLRAASDQGTIRLIDALAIQKQQDGTIVSLGATDLTPDERMEFGAVVGALMGFGATGTTEGAEEGAEIGAMAFAEQNFGLSDNDIRAIAGSIPTGTTAVMVLFEHRWAVKLKEAMLDAGGVVLAQGLVQPETLLALGAELGYLAEADVPAQQISASEKQVH